MASPPAPYDRRFFDDRTAGSLLSASRILPRVLELVPIKSAVDVGCGVGTWVKAMIDLGITDCIGVDGNYVVPSDLLVPSSQFRAMDLKNPTYLGKRFDLVISLEVAEHLPMEVANAFISFLAAHGDVILFSAATPLQGGTDHQNEQWPSYWAKLFAANGYTAIDCLRLTLFNDEHIDWWYAQNTILYANEAALQRFPGLRALPSTNASNVAALVHPRLLKSWARRVEERVPNATLRELIRAVPRALKRCVSHRVRSIARR